MIHHRLHNGIQLFIDDFDLFKPAHCAARLFLFSLSLAAVIFHMRGSNVVSIYLIVLLRLGMRGCASTKYSIRSQMLSLYSNRWSPSNDRRHPLGVAADFAQESFKISFQLPRDSLRIKSWRATSTNLWRQDFFYCLIIYRQALKAKHMKTRRSLFVGKFLSFHLLNTIMSCCKNISSFQI
jgi:hypothetical protein